jgi:hypothetical protein
MWWPPTRHAAIAHSSTLRGRCADAIVADWRLGARENGLQAIERLHARFGPKPAALVTGEIDPTISRAGAPAESR